MKQTFMWRAPYYVKIYDYMVLASKQLEKINIFIFNRLIHFSDYTFFYINVNKWGKQVTKKKQKKTMDKKECLTILKKHYTSVNDRL